MLTQNDVDYVASYFKVFHGVRSCNGTLTDGPSVTLDMGARHEDESYILIEGGGLPIGKFLDAAGRPYYTVHNQDGDEVYKDVHLFKAVKEAMLRYTGELFRRMSDYHAANAMAEDFANCKR